MFEYFENGSHRSGDRKQGCAEEGIQEEQKACFLPLSIRSTNPLHTFTQALKKKGSKAATEAEKQEQEAGANGNNSNDAAAAAQSAEDASAVSASSEGVNEGMDSLCR